MNGLRSPSFSFSRGWGLKWLFINTLYLLEKSGSLQFKTKTAFFWGFGLYKSHFSLSPHSTHILPIWSGFTAKKVESYPSNNHYKTQTTKVTLSRVYSTTKFAASNCQLPFFDNAAANSILSVSGPN